MANSYLMRKCGLNKVLRIHKSLAYMEQSKYLDPKISFSFDDLAGILRSNNSCTESTRMSNISGIDKLSAKNYTMKSFSNNSSRILETKRSRKSECLAVINLTIIYFR